MKSECVYGCHCVAAEHGVRTMACGHGVCGECLQLLVGRARGERVAECRGDSGAVSVADVQCPVCVCETDAAETFGQPPMAKRMRAGRTAVCERHPERVLDRYCLDDKVFVCVECAEMRAHRKHRVVPVVGIAGKVKELESELRERCSRTFADMKEKLKAEIETCFEKAHDVVEQQKKRLLSAFDGVLGPLEPRFEIKWQAMDNFAAECETLLDVYRRMQGSEKEMDAVKMLMDLYVSITDHKDSLYEKDSTAIVHSNLDVLEDLEVCSIRSFVQPAYVQRNPAFITAPAIRSDLPSSFADMVACGSFFYEPLQAVISTTRTLQEGRTLQVLHTSPKKRGQLEKYDNLIPFLTAVPPIFDGGHYAYFSEWGGVSKRFGRVDLNTFAFEELPSLTDGVFGPFFHGYVWGNKVFCVKDDRTVCAFNLATGLWSDMPYKVQEFYSRLHIHPWNTQRCIELVVDGSIHEFDIETGHNPRIYKEKYTNYAFSAESFVLAAPRGQFYVLACNGFGKQPWRVFSSETDTWVDTTWPTTNNRSHHMWLDGKKNTLSFYVNGDNTWFTVTLPR